MIDQKDNNHNKMDQHFRGSRNAEHINLTTGEKMKIIAKIANGDIMSCPKNMERENCYTNLHAKQHEESRYWIMSLCDQLFGIFDSREDVLYLHDKQITQSMETECKELELIDETIKQFISDSYVSKRIEVSEKELEDLWFLDISPQQSHSRKEVTQC